MSLLSVSGVWVWVFFFSALFPESHHLIPIPSSSSDAESDSRFFLKKVLLLVVDDDAVDANLVC
jgi:hypothetical protein